MLNVLNDYGVPSIHFFLATRINKRESQPIAYQSVTVFVHGASAMASSQGRKWDCGLQKRHHKDYITRNDIEHIHHIHIYIYIFMYPLRHCLSINVMESEASILWHNLCKLWV